MNLEFNDEIIADDEDYGFIDEEITKFANDLTAKEPLDTVVKNALNKKKKLT